MSSKTVHLCLNIAGALQNSRLKGLVTDDQGRELSAKESRAWLLEQQAMGRRVLPFGDPCEGFDYQTGCPGHPRQDLPGDPFERANTAQGGGGVETSGQRVQEALAVCKRLDLFQREYEVNTHGNKMPGNDYYSPQLMAIVEEARAALSSSQGSGLNIVVSEAVPPGTVAMVQDGKITGVIRNVAPEASRAQEGPRSVKCLYCGKVSDLGRGAVVYEAPEASPAAPALVARQWYDPAHDCKNHCAMCWAFRARLDSKRPPEAPKDSPALRECTCVDRCKGAAGLAPGWYCGLEAERAGRAFADPTEGGDSPAREGADHG